VIGFAFDGFPIHGPYESDGVMAKDLEGDRALDVCNGHEDSERGYHYHVTPGRFPYVIGGYHGVPEPSNNRGLRWMGTGAIEDNAEGESRMEAVIAEVTRCELSRTAASGRPTMITAGVSAPRALTSTSTSSASTPRNAAEYSLVII
jgi:hypothetical protein